MEVHWGLAVGILACALSWVLIEKTRWGFAARIAGGNVRGRPGAGACRRLADRRLTGLAGAFAGLAGMLSAAAAGQRQRLACPPAMAMPAFSSPSSPATIRWPSSRSPSCLRHRCVGGLDPAPHGPADATVLVLQGMLFIVILFSETFYGRFKAFNPTCGKGRSLEGVCLMDAARSASGACHSPSSAGHQRVSTPFIFVSLGEAITERSAASTLASKARWCLAQ